MKKTSWAKDVRDHFGFEVMYSRHERPELKMWEHKRDAALEVARCLFLAAICTLRGHDYTTDGVDYVESGGEGFECKRCGHSFTAWH